MQLLKSVHIWTKYMIGHDIETLYDPCSQPPIEKMLGGGCLLLLLTATYIDKDLPKSNVCLSLWNTSEVGEINIKSCLIIGIKPVIYQSNRD